MSDNVIVTDSMSDLFSVRLNSDHMRVLAMRNKLERRPSINAKGEVIGSEFTISHTDFIDFINELAM